LALSGIINFKDDIVISESIDKIGEVFNLIIGFFSNCFALCGHIHDVNVVVKLSIEAAKHYQAAAHKDAGVPSSGIWDLMADFNLVPGISNDIKAVNITDITVISATQNKELILVHNGCCMSPSRGRNIKRKINFGANHFFRLLLNKVFHFKNIEVIQMHIF
jgi:hypothetical protein